MRNGQVVRRTLLLKSIVLIVCVASTGCVAHRSVESTYEKIAAELEPGDRVEVELKDGQELSFRVTEIRETEMTGDTSTDITKGEVVTVRYSDVKRLERVDQRPLVVVGTVFGAPFIFLGIAILILMAGGGAAPM